MSNAHPNPSVLESRLDHRFRQPAYLERALTHSSYAHEAAQDPDIGREDNEALEFLGDAVLSFLTAEMIYRERPEAPEGIMSRAKAGLVSDANLARTARQLDLGSYLRLGVGEERSGGRGKASLLAGALEALLAAVFLDGGIGPARRVVERLFRDQLDAGTPVGPAADAKTALQELLQGRGHVAPTYRVVDESGPDHRKRFQVEVIADGEVRGAGEGPSKKAAEQRAARAALEAMEEAPPGQP
jgi:ribonuclease III